MEAMTCSFSSKTRAQVDDIIFYTGPPTKKSCELASTDANEWPDVDEIIAQTAQEGWTTGIEDFDFVTRFDSTGEGKLCLQLLCTGTANTSSERISRHNRYGLYSTGGHFTRGAFRAGRHVCVCSSLQIAGFGP